MVANNEAGTTVGFRFKSARRGAATAAIGCMPTYELLFRCAACSEPIAVTVPVDAFDPKKIAELTCRRCHHDVMERTAPTFAVKSTCMDHEPELASRPPRKPRSRRRKKLGASDVRD